MLAFDAFEALTFDCYGTLIDWETGLWEALQPIFTHHGMSIAQEPVLELYGTLEAAAERGPYLPYRAVLRTVLMGMGARLGFVPTAAELERFADSVAAWPAFPDSAQALQALHTRYKLAIVSNVDDDLFAGSARRLQVPFDAVITAQQVQSYKPALAHFHVALARLGLPHERVLHVAQSVYHDIAPAQSLGLHTVWVNRRQATPGTGATPPAHAQPDLEVLDVSTLARRMGLL